MKVVEVCVVSGLNSKVHYAQEFWLSVFDNCICHLMNAVKCIIIIRLVYNVSRNIQLNMRN